MEPTPAPSAFPDTPTFTGYNTPTLEEIDAPDLEIVGEMPAELRGDFYRCGPDPRYPPRLGDDVYINGDGMIGQFRLGDGRADYRCRYVRTEKFLAEERAGKALFGAYRNPFTDDASVSGVDRSTANTAAFFHAGRLFALKEDGLPYRIDPGSLQTLGRHDFGGRLRSLTVTAHPKLDASTGEWMFFGYEADGLASPRVAYAIADADGQLVQEQWFSAPYPAMQHDFAVTRDYVIFLVFPTTADIERMRAGGDHWAWQDDLPAWLGLMPRNGAVEDIRWRRYPAASSFHVANAFNDGSTVCIDLLMSKRNGFPYIRNADGSAPELADLLPFPTRLTLDAANPEGAVETTRLSPIPGELPMIDRRLSTTQHRTIYYGGISPELPPCITGPVGPGFNTLVSVDTGSGRLATFSQGPNRTFQEPQFVGSAERPGGYLVVVSDHHDTSDARLLILPADDIAAGPLAEVVVPFRLRATFHGCWVAAGARHGV